MKKSEFLISLKKNLNSIPEYDRRKTIQYYSEMIDDRIEEGFSEEDAVGQMGSVYELAAQIKADYGEAESIKERSSASFESNSKKSVNGWVIFLLILGFPLWFSLLVAALVVFVSFLVTLWSVIIAFWSVFVSFVVGSFSGITVGVILNLLGNIVPGTAMIGSGLILAGLSILAFFGCKASTNGAVFLTKKIAVLIKNCFVKKEKI